MSVTLRSYMIDLEAYRAIQGSGDLALIERICTHYENAIAADDRWLAQLRPDHLPIAAALQDIARGQIRDGQAAALSYPIAAEYLADFLGERIDDEAIAEHGSDLATAIDGAISGMLVRTGRPRGDWPLLAEVLARGPALRIPWEIEALPNGTGTIAAEEANRAARTVEEIAPCEDEDQDPDEDDESARELASIYGDWLKQAAAANRALLLVCD